MLQFCPLASGSSGNSLFIGSEKTKILLDAGLSARLTASRLAELEVAVQDIDAILITHEHIDHTRGMAALACRYQIPVYATEETWYKLEAEGNTVPEPHPFAAGDKIEVGDLQFDSFPLPHDAVDPVGFCVYHRENKLSLATDLGHAPAYLEKLFTGSRLVFLEANHDEEMLKVGTYPWFLKRRILGDRGHLSNAAAGDFLAKVAGGETTHVSLGHLSLNNNLPELAYATVADILRDHAVYPERDVALTLNRHGEMGKPVRLE